MDNENRFGCFRYGIVTKIDPKKALVRVRWTDQDLESGWLPMVRMYSQNNKHYAMPDIGEQVVVIGDFLQEDGAVLGAIYSDVDKVPVSDPNKTHMRWKDGTIAEYDRVTHHAKLVVLEGSILLQVGATRVLIDNDGVVINP